MYSPGLPWWLSGKNLPANAGDASSTLGFEAPLEKGMATHSSILDWEIPLTEERSLAGYSPWGHTLLYSRK